MDDLFSFPTPAVLATSDVRLTKLVVQLKLGCLAGAMLTIKGADAQEVERLMLAAGFSSVGYRSKDFWLHVQQQLVEAARAKVDGWGLKELKKISSKGLQS